MMSQSINQNTSPFPHIIGLEENGAKVITYPFHQINGAKVSIERGEWRPHI